LTAFLRLGGVGLATVTENAVEIEKCGHFCSPKRVNWVKKVALSWV
jgi:hypothetical protein